VKKFALIFIVLAAALYFWLGSSGDKPSSRSDVPVKAPSILGKKNVAPEKEPMGSLRASAEWKEYLGRYTSSEPLLAMRQTYAPLFSPSNEEVKSILSGGTKLRFDPPIFDRDRQVRIIDITDDSHAIRFEVHDQVDIQGRADEETTKKEILASENRFTKMRENMRDLIYKRDPRTLIIMNVGTTHALDLYFGSYMNPFPSADDPVWRLKKEVQYLALPFREDTRFYTSDYWKYYEAFTGTPINEEVGKSFMSLLRTVFLQRLYYYHSLNRANIGFQQLTTERNLTDLGVLVIMDIHHSRFPQIFDEMPSAVSLQQSGFDKVIYAQEGWKYSKDYKLEDLADFHTLTMDDEFYGARAEDDKKFYEQFRPKAFQYLKQGVRTWETLYSAHQKLQEWRSGGIDVQVIGLEEFDRFDEKRRSKLKEEEQLEAE